MSNYTYRPKMDNFLYYELCQWDTVQTLLCRTYCRLQSRLWATKTYALVALKKRYCEEMSLLLVYKQQHDERGITESLPAYINKARLIAYEAGIFRLDWTGLDS